MFRDFKILLDPFRKSEVRRQQVLGVKVINDFHCIFRSINNIKQIEVTLVNHGFGNEDFLDPIYESAPKFLAHQDNGESPDLLCLNQGKGLGQFVHGAKSSWHNNKSLRVFYEHHFANKKVIKRDELVRIDVGISFLFVR